MFRTVLQLRTHAASCNVEITLCNLFQPKHNTKNKSPDSLMKSVNNNKTTCSQREKYCFSGLWIHMKQDEATQYYTAQTSSLSTLIAVMNYSGKHKSQ